MWSLDTSEAIEGFTWWWWWWIFFIDNPADPAHPRQLMILWSTKNCDRILVNDVDWQRRFRIAKDVATGSGHLRADGMVGVWYYDGERMQDPLCLERCDLRTEWEGEGGRLWTTPDREVDGADAFDYHGDPALRTVHIRKGHFEFTFEMTPWNDFQTKPRFHQRRYIGRMGYSILKIFGSRLRGSIRRGDHRELVTGTAYFQKVMVNAPAVPWYWGVFHGEEGSYLDYFGPHFGLPVLRNVQAPESRLDRGYFFLNRNIQFYHAPSSTHALFTKGVRIAKRIEDGLPTFRVTAEDGRRSLMAEVRAYSRAHWRFEQRYLRWFRSILYYNEYPSEMTVFRFKDGPTTVRREDLGQVAGNTEHAWGWLV